MHPDDELRANKAAGDVAADEGQFTAIKIGLATVKRDLALAKWKLVPSVGDAAGPGIKACSSRSPTMR